MLFFWQKFLTGKSKKLTTNLDVIIEMTFLYEFFSAFGNVAFVRTKARVSQLMFAQRRPEQEQDWFRA